MQTHTINCLLHQHAFALCVIARYVTLNIGISIKGSINTGYLLYGRGVPLGHIGTGVAISARGPIWLASANMT